ncbi:hypothetical protein E3P99_00272 [Wallemia hederae]|uniref:Mitochondrial adapter protein MCP1 transmembrane domain-containing protein n=1 Tax=Wallemia hederae TaxID=1540922 RepID=A0A4T0FWU2_9BASI|nr:hypothetical protein E3P99_00272 [Wallemia hederae]
MLARLESNHVMPISSANEKPYQRLQRLNKRLARVQTYSGIAFGSFALLHSVPTILAAGGGVGIVDDIVMISRTLYHAPYAELVWVAGSAGVHVLASVIRRLVQRRISFYSESKPAALTAQQKSGYALIPLLLAHSLSHRVIPSFYTPPISALSPSELSYAHFVAYAARSRPYLSTAAYTTLAGLSVYHAITGLRRSRKARTVAAKASLTYAVTTALALLNLARSFEELHYLTPRYEAVYRHLYV